MGQVMYVHEATAILHRVPGITLVLRENPVKMSSHAPPAIDVRYRGRSIGFIEKQIMDEQWHREDPDTGKEYPAYAPNMTSSRMDYVAPWPQTFATINARINDKDRAALRKECGKRGFEFWRKR